MKSVRHSRSCVPSVLYAKVPWAMSEQQRFFKANCRVCGGRIEVPATAEGMTIECPHCHQQTELRPAEQASRSIAQLLVFAAVGLALALWVLFLIKPRPPAHPLATVTNAAPAPEVKTEPPRPKSPDDLKLTTGPAVEKAKGSRLTYATGIVTNDSDHARYGVKIELDVFDQSGTKLSAQATDYIQQLEPRKAWPFRALVLDAKATSAKLARIKEEE